jgi:amino acid transporter
MTVGDSTTRDDSGLTEVSVLHRFGYHQRLRRSMRLYSSFSLAFAEIAITVTVFTLFAQPFQTLGGVAIWIWIPVTAGGFLIATIWGHLTARIPLTGYAYSWVSRLVNPEYGWFCGWTELVGWVLGTAGIAVAAASVFSPYFWAAPTHGDIELFAAIAIILGLIANIISVKITALVNNISASAELFGTLGLGIVVAIGIIFFAHVQGPKILFHVGSTGGGAVTISALALAALLPVYTILGWDASADLAEETKDPRRVIPKAMRRAVLIGGVCGFFLFAVYAMAIRGSVATLVGGTQNPLIAVFESHFGSGAGYVIIVIAAFAMFSALLANIAAAGRVAYALGRDNMLPVSPVWNAVNKTTRTPVYSLVAVGIIAELANVASAGFVGRILAGVTVAGYGIYAFVLVGVLISHRTGRLPAADDGYFSMGKWLVPATWVALAWSIFVMLMMTLPAANQIAGQYFLYIEAVGALWFVAVLMWRLRRGQAGPNRQEIAAGDLQTGEAELSEG